MSYRNRGSRFASELTKEGASFIATKHIGFALILPLTLRAERWQRAHVDRQATGQGDELVVETRYLPDLAVAIIEAGFLFERNALPN